MTPNLTILFDGTCGLCHRMVRFTLSRDKKNQFQYHPLQSDIAKNLLHHLPAKQLSMDSIVFIDNDRYYFESDAFLYMVRYLPGLWPILFSLTIIPAVIRNVIYRFVARNRHRWFGEVQSCPLPNNKQQKKIF